MAPLVVAVALTGCAAADHSGGAGAKAAISARPHGTPAIPAGAVAIGEELYQLPLGSDADGCLMYQLYSPDRPVPLAISYRAPDGSFTKDQRRALCDPDLIRRR